MLSEYYVRIKKWILNIEDHRFSYVINKQAVPGWGTACKSVETALLSDHHVEYCVP